MKRFEEQRREQAKLKEKDEELARILSGKLAEVRVCLEILDIKTGILGSTCSSSTQ